MDDRDPDFREIVDRLRARGHFDSQPPVPPLPPERGGGTSGGGMESRIAKLEAQMDAVRIDLGRLAGLPVDVARLDERIKHLPGKGFVVTSAVGTIGAITGLLVLLQHLGLLH